jgi:hypothetical protein
MALLSLALVERLVGQRDLSGELYRAQCFASETLALR